jgi:hypothetical protein
MFYQGQNWVKAEEYDALVDKYNRLSETLRENRLFSFLYLHLSGQKNLIEEKAYSLANKHGLLGALRLQPTTAAAQNNR